MEKINELLRQQLSLLLFQDFPDEIVSINFVYTDKDLSESKIYITVDSGHQSVYNELKFQSSKYRKELSDKLFIRRIPKLLFIKDEKQSDVDRIEEILEKK